MSNFRSKFGGMNGEIVVEDDDYVDGLTFTIREDLDTSTEVHLGKDELLRLHAALGTYIFREGLAL